MISDVALGLDGTLVRLGRYPSRSDMDPGLEPKMFTCRKWYAALNVMAVGDMDGLLRYIDVRWPGSGVFSRFQAVILFQIECRGI